MIMARNEDGTYSQVGFVKDNVGIDTEYIYDKDGDIVFEKGFTRETSGTVPLTINGIGKDLKAWSITGNTVQNGTPTPENPVEVLGCGERTGNIVAAEANHINPMVGLSVVWKKGGSEMIINGKATGGESARFATIELDAGTYTLSITGLDETGWSKTGFYLSGVDTARVQGERTYTITEPTSARLQFVVNPSDVSYENRKVTIMFTKTSTALPYEPYGYKIPVVTSADGAEPITTPIYLDKPLYKIGDYADTLCYAEQKEERYIKELILTGEENITQHSVINDIVGVRIPTPATVAAASPAICTHAINVTWANFYASRTYAKVATNAGGGNSIVYMSAPDSEHNTLSGIKDYLAAQYAAGTPVKVYYVMKTPETKTVEPVEIPTLNGTTVIDVDTAVKPTEMYTKYKSSK